MAALASIELALASDPGSAETRYKKGEILRTLTRDSEAIMSFDEAIRLNPANTLAKSAKKDIEARNYTHTIASDILDHQQIIDHFKERIEEN